MMNKSIWEATFEGKKYPVFSGQQEADIVIIGGGITGITAALKLSEAGKKVIVLEAGHVGGGTTGNSTGNLYVTVDEHLSVIRSKWNDEVMQNVVDSRREALNFIAKTIDRFEIECDFTNTSFNFFCEHPDEEIEKFINDENEALISCSLRPTLSQFSHLPFPVKRVLSVEGQAQFHPYKYISKLAEQVSSKCSIYEHSAVIDLNEKEGIVKTVEGTVKAKYIIMATHTPKGVWMVQGATGPYREFGLAADLKSGDFPAGIYWGLDKPKHSVRCFSHGGKKYVMVIGDKFKTGQADDTREYLARLEKFLKDRFDLGTERYVWGGQQYRPADGLPYIGRHSDKLYFMTGFATDGLVYGTLAAMIVSDEITGTENKWAKTYSLKRFTPIKSFKEYFRENLDNIVQYVKDTPWNVDAHSLDEIRAGEGKVIESGGEKVAVFKDVNGNMHCVSAVCTHMKCVVNWNEVEKSWDCPCHGSRFNTDGRVLEGPALINLPKKNPKN